VFCRETAELLVTVHFLVPFLLGILIFVYFCLKVDEESDLLFRAKQQPLFTVSVNGLITITIACRFP